MDYRCIKCSSLMGFKHEYPPISNFGKVDCPVALFSINPSFNEFKKKGRRPAPFNSWDVNNRCIVFDEKIDSHKKQQDNYFSSGNYYKEWFNPVEGFLNLIKSDLWGELSFGINHEVQNVVHLDIVKCSTTKIWRDLKDPFVKDSYINNCKEFLLPQLFLPNLRVILVNGKTVKDVLYGVLKDHFIFEQEEEYSYTLHLWTRTEEERLTEIMTVNDSKLTQFSVNVGRSVNACKERWKKIKKEGFKAPTVVNTTWALYRYVISSKDSDRKWLVVGTSQRISPDDQGRFRNNHDRAKAAAKIQQWINEFTY
ncbi:hypothetical protein [Fictibacillus enclensis]|uniref:hypothetical protein n=1 Tax=Fictibacillus enclensis TaxID=1017270 RepID=UPI0024BF846F|nr:hypothetical protein [Fictibacillus enclensis]WHY72649.1 hypothetical protein QNH15_01535 [Fictibacillus enclensis]